MILIPIQYLHKRSAIGAFAIQKANIFKPFKLKIDFIKRYATLFSKGAKADKHFTRSKNGIRSGTLNLPNGIGMTSA